MKIIYTKGQIVGNCTYINEVEGIKGQRAALFECKCGEKFIARIRGVVKGSNKWCKECGLKIKSAQGIINGTTHGMKNDIAYKIWKGMKKRCYNKNDINYKYYGAKGIKVCDRWLNSFENFYQDMGPRPSKEYTIERDDNNKGYEPSNCRWLHKSLQTSNQSSNIVVTYKGKTQNVSAWAREIGINYYTLINRISRKNWPIERALTEKVRKNKFPSFINHSFGYIN